MFKMHVNRRTALAYGGMAAIAPTFVKSTSFAQTRPKFSMENLHVDISSVVRDMAGAADVSIVVLYPEGSIANLEPIGALFRKLTGVQIVFQSAPLDDIVSRIVLSNLTDNVHFDVALAATFGIPDLAQSGAIRNLDEYSQTHEPAEFQQSALYSVGDYYKGSLYGYQTDGDAYVMFYNKNMMEDMDEKKRFADQFDRPLQVPVTWRELDETMAFFHRPEKNRFGGSLFRTARYLPWEWWIRFHGKGYFPFDDTMQPQIDNSAGIEALEEMVESSRFLDPRAWTDGLFDNWKSFSQGQSFCNIGWGGAQKYFNQSRSKIRGQLISAPLPGGSVRGQTLHMPYFNWGKNYVVSSNSRNPEIAYLFTLFACSPVVSARSVAVIDGYFDPFRSTHYDNADIKEIYSNEFLATHRHSMLNAIPDLYLDGQGEYFGALRENIAATFTGELDARTALNRTARQWRLTTFRRGTESQLEQWRFLKSRYPVKLQDLLE